MLAKILSQRHGFKCTVLFSVDPDGTINPKNVEVPVEPRRARHGGCHRDAAALPRLARRGHGALRQAAASRQRPSSRCARARTHSTGSPKGGPWETWNYNNQGGFGKRVLGETWLTHWGRHKVEATRGVIEPASADTRSCAASRISSATPTCTKPIRRPTRRSSSAAWCCRRWRRTPRRRTTRRRARPTNSSKASTIRRCRSCGRA